MLCRDDDVLSKVLANRLRDVMDSITQQDQTCCIPQRTIRDSNGLKHYFDVSRLLGMDAFGLISLDQQNAFDWVEHHGCCLICPLEVVH